VTLHKARVRAQPGGNRNGGGNNAKTAQFALTKERAQVADGRREDDEGGIRRYQFNEKGSSDHRSGSSCAERQKGRGGFRTGTASAGSVPQSGGPSDREGEIKSAQAARLGATTSNDGIS